MKVVTAGIAVSIVLPFLVSVASAGPKEDVAAATLKWAQALGEDDPDKVLPLYSDDAVLWGTLSPTVRVVPPYEIILWQPSRFCPASRSHSATR